MNTQQAFARIFELFKANNIADSQDEARILLCHTVNTTPARLFASPEAELTDSQQKLLNELAARRIRHEPSPYLTGKKEFYGIEFYVNQNVLIPRPETELLVEQAILAGKHISTNHPQRKLTVADIGTGCGAIAISIALNIDAEVFAVDLSPEALEVARRNCDTYGILHRIHLLQGNLLEPIHKPLDIVVANLPYISSIEMNTLSPEIINFEPVLALEGGKDGTDIIEELLRTCRPHLQARSTVILEFGYKQRKHIEKLIDKYLPGSNSIFFRDIAGLDRAVSIFI